MKHEKLLIYLVSRFCKRNPRSRKLHTYEDWKQIAYVVLIKATRSWDESRGIAFSTYASTSILRELYRELKTAGVIRISSKYQQDGYEKNAKIARRITFLGDIPLISKPGKIDEYEIATKVAELPERERLAIQEKYFNWKTNDEVGKVLGVCGERARKILDRALQTLKEKMHVHNMGA